MGDRGLELKIGTLTFLRVDNSTLMLHRNKDENDFLFGKYVAPGGKVEDGETPEGCAIREFQEETGITLNKINYRGKVFFDNKDRNFQGKPAKFNFLVYVFEADSYSGNLAHPENGTLTWVKNEDLRKLPIEKGDHFIIEWLESQEPINYRIFLSDDDARYEPLEKEL